jgi:hypothetical protein
MVLIVLGAEPNVHHVIGLSVSIRFCKLKHCTAVRLFVVTYAVFEYAAKCEVCGEIRFIWPKKTVGDRHYGWVDNGMGHAGSLRQPVKLCRWGRLLATVFWDAMEILLVKFIEYDTTITSEVYCDTLKKPKRAIQDKRLLRPGSNKCGAQLDFFCGALYILNI